jgi:hypothetical protein
MSLVEAPRPHEPRIFIRGNASNPGKPVPRQLPTLLAKERKPFEKTSGRLETAQAIASRDNPLTARVIVNRVWQHHFGVGLVATSDNFGRRGEPPSHPELMDYLALRFLESGWSVKDLHRLLLLSSTYQQQSTANPGGLQIDPDNRLLWRMPRKRLAAEAIRDAMLAASGRLDRAVGGGDSAELLYKQAEVLDDKRGFAPNRLQTDHPVYTNSPRRSIYLPVVRNALPDVLALFDAADPNGVTARRNDTTVPSQALWSLNNPFVRAQALHLAQRLLADEELPQTDRVVRAHELILGRPATADELVEALDYLDQYRKSPAAAARPEPEQTQSAWQSLCHTLLCLNEFMYVD